MKELASTQPGYFEIFEGAGESGWYFVCNCPCGCKYPDSVPLNRQGDTKYEATGFGWVWDGNLTHPTITPSFKRHTPCGVHFNIERGRYRVHADGAPLAPNVYVAP